MVRHYDYRITALIAGRAFCIGAFENLEIEKYERSVEAVAAA